MLAVAAIITVVVLFVNIISFMEAKKRHAKKFACLSPMLATRH
jgi:hypothetical protein